MSKNRKQANVIQRMRQVLRVKNYADRTEEIYTSWVKRFVRFYDLERDPADMEPEEIVAFLDHLANVEKVAPATQNQALNAIAFLFRDVLGKDMGDVSDFARAKATTRLPTVLTHSEATRVVEAVAPPNHLAAMLMYGAGLRVSESVKLRVKDVDFARRELIIRQGKGDKDRVTVLAEALVGPLKEHFDDTLKPQHESDVERGDVITPLPGALAKKKPGAERMFAWQFVFPNRKPTFDKQRELWVRWHRSTATVQRAVKIAVKQTGVDKDASCHTLRHSFATQLLRNGTDIRTVQKLLGHTSVRTTMKYLHVLGRGAFGVRSPLDS